MNRFWNRAVLLLCWLLAFGAASFLGCATDVVVTQGVIAEQKKIEAEQAEKQKKELENKIQDAQKLMEEQKQKTDESGNN